MIAVPALFLLASLHASGIIQAKLDPSHEKRTDGANNSWATYTISYVPKDRLSLPITCTNACRGGKHLLHPECDKSCDLPCKEKHSYRFSPGISKNEDDSQLLLDAQKFGDASLGTAVQSGAFDQLMGLYSTNSKVYKLDHWNKTPCSTDTLIQWEQQYDMRIKYAYFRNDEGPDGTKILVKGPSGEVGYALIHVPDGDLTNEDIKIKCKCSVIQEEHSSTGVYIKDGSQYALATTKQIQDYGITAACPDINTCTISCANPTPMPMTLKIGAGTEFECDDESCQDEVLSEDVQFTCPAGATASIDVPRSNRRSLVNAAAGAASKDGHANCITMHRPMPKPGVKYSFRMPAQASMARLALDTSQHMIGGPWDQVRLWIVSDHASREEMAKILIPRPTHSTYLRALYDVNHITGLDLTTPDYSACLQPDEIIGGTASKEATYWYAQLWAEKAPKAMGDWLTQNTAAFTAECFGPDARPAAPQHAADMINALCCSGQADMIRAGMVCLKAVPADKRDLIAKDHGLDAALLQLSKPDAGIAGLAMEVAELYMDKATKDALLNLDPSLPVDLKDRAKKLFAQLNAP